MVSRLFVAQVLVSSILMRHIKHSYWFLYQKSIEYLYSWAGPTFKNFVGELFPLIFTQKFGEGLSLCLKTISHVYPVWALFHIKVNLVTLDVLIQYCLNDI